MKWRQSACTLIELLTSPAALDAGYRFSDFSWRCRKHLEKRRPSLSRPLVEDICGGCLRGSRERPVRIGADRSHVLYVWHFCPNLFTSTKWQIASVRPANHNIYWLFLHMDSSRGSHQVGWLLPWDGTSASASKTTVTFLSIQITNCNIRRNAIPSSLNVILLRTDIAHPHPPSISHRHSCTLVGLQSTIVKVPPFSTDAYKTKCSVHIFSMYFCHNIQQESIKI